MKNGSTLKQFVPYETTHESIATCILNMPGYSEYSVLVKVEYLLPVTYSV